MCKKMSNIANVDLTVTYDNTQPERGTKASIRALDTLAAEPAARRAERRNRRKHRKDRKEGRS